MNYEKIISESDYHMVIGTTQDYQNCGYLKFVLKLCGLC